MVPRSLIKTYPGDVKLTPGWETMCIHFKMAEEEFTMTSYLK